MRLVLVQPRLSHRAGADNLGVLRALLSPLTGDSGGGEPLGDDDLVVLPERYHLGDSPHDYQAEVAALAVSLRCNVIGGSQHERRGATRVHSGVAVDARGEVLGRYEKLRPYAAERSWVAPGTLLGELVVANRRVLVLVCADFWFSDLVLQARELPDLVLVPALSVSRKDSPAYSRTLWRHLCVARAYELGAYVGVSDWAWESELPALRSSGVAGLADPTAIEPERLFEPVPASGVLVRRLDLPALEQFRDDRRARGFFWK